MVEVPDELLDYYERIYIDVYGTFGKWGYNQTRGGDVNPMHDASVRAKCAATHARPEVKAKHMEAMRVAMGDPDRRKRISKTLSETLATPEAREKRSEQVAATWLGDNEERKESLKAAWVGRKKERGAGIKAGLNKPESKKKHIDALRKNAKNPEIQEKKRVAMKVYWAAKKAAKNAPPPPG